MNTKEYDKADKAISRLCAKGEKVIESECFNRVNYLIKDKHIIILAGKSGEFAIAMDKVADFTREINEICSLWQDVNTDKCIIPSGKNEAKAEKRERKQRRGKKG